MAKPLFVWQERVLVKIKTENIIALATEKNYTKIFMPDKKYYFVRTSLVRLLKKLPKRMFVKTHRAYAVAIERIEEVYKDHVIVENEGIPVARQFYNKIVSHLEVVE